MNVTRIPIGLLLVSLTPVILCGCLGLDPQPDPSRYFVLGAAEPAPAVAEQECAQKVLIGPVTLAGHLDNPKIARRVGMNEIRYADWDFWAEPLSRSLPRELRKSLEKTQPGLCFADFRRASVAEGMVRLAVSVDRFEMTDGGEVLVEASWTVSTPGESTGKRGGIRFSRTSNGEAGDTTAGIQALHQALDELAVAIAADVE